MTYLDSRHFEQPRPQLVLELVFYDDNAASHFDHKDCKDILLRNKAIFAAAFLDPIDPVDTCTLDIAVGIDLSLAHVKEMVDTLEELIQHTKRLLFLFAAYYSVATGAIGAFVWRYSNIYKISHGYTIEDTPGTTTPEPRIILQTAAHVLAHSDLHSVDYNILPTSDPHEILIAPY